MTTPDIPLGLSSVGHRTSLREQVTEALRAALVSGALRAGVVYSAPGLAEQFGVSATPVREAMLDLVKAGLVEAVPNKGFRVLELTSRDLDEYTAIRALLEPPMVALVAGSVSRDRIEALRPLALAVVAAAARRDVLAYVEADNAFHLALLGLAGNGHLVEVVRDLRYRSRLYGVPALAARDELEPSARQHVELLDVVLSGDAEAAAAMMRSHLGHVRGMWASE
ncbi:MAG TPA: GntR family transcriptional regulator [Pseudonocardiaceae bacterium]|nr:GntR family transcriptional regulator [Pseudonocardiaceae bacterium]